MKRGGGLLPARTDCWPPTKRPRATPGGLIAASVTCLSRREGVPPCLRTSPPLGGTLGVFFLGFVVPVPPSPFFQAGLVALFFFFLFFLSLFPVVRCYWLGVAGFGWVVRLCLCGGPPFFFFFFFFFFLGGGPGRLWCCWRVVGRLWAVFVPFPLPPSFFFFFLGGGLPVPPSAFPGLAHALACIQCCLPGCCFQLRSVWPCSGPMGRVGSVHGGLGAPSCWVRSWLCRLGGCARRLLVVLG